MALNSTQQWWVRTDGSELNGGGFDAAISGAGTNYSDQASAQLTITDGATSGANSTTLTSAAAGFTSQMVGNIIRISAGTNFQTGYYAITAYTNSSTVTLDHTPTSGGAGSGGTGKIGGAHAWVNSYANGGTGTQPILTTPLLAGHTVNIRGSGSADPSSADYTDTSGYLTYPFGDHTSGWIQWIGYNGRPYIFTGGLQWYGASDGKWIFRHIKSAANAANQPHGLVGLGNPILCIDCIFDQAGYDSACVNAGVINCEFRNTGGGGVATWPLLEVQFGQPVLNCYFHGARTDALNCASNNSTINRIANNIITGAGRYGIYFNGAVQDSYETTVINNTIDSCASDGIRFGTAGDFFHVRMLYNNIFSNNGGYGINLNFGSATANEAFRVLTDYNDFYNNASGAMNNLNAGTHDQTVNPGYTNSAGADYSISAAI